MWFQYLSERLVKRAGFIQSEVDECIFYRGSVIYVLYTDDSILTGPDKGEIDRAVKAIQDAKLKLRMVWNVMKMMIRSL